jgi:hypothetical protein
MTDRERNLRRRYNMTLDHYDELWRIQAGRCAICRTKPTDALCVDHDHLTGEIRGLLCHSCNRGIGLLGDDLSRIRSAVSYLTAHAVRLSECENDCH